MNDAMLKSGNYYFCGNLWLPWQLKGKKNFKNLMNGTPLVTCYIDKETCSHSKTLFAWSGFSLSGERYRTASAFLLLFFVWGVRCDIDEDVH